jgi:hypothetical protein
MPALSIFEITFPEEIENLAKVYFNKVAPCYGLVNRQIFFQRLEERSQSTLRNDRYDSAFAGIAALGSLFSRNDVTVTEVHLVQSARSKLDQLSWVESSVVGTLSLEGIEFEQLFLKGGNSLTEGSDFIPPIPPT